VSKGEKKHIGLKKAEENEEQEKEEEEREMMIM
jgi:hypothetical protein